MRTVRTIRWAGLALVAVLASAPVLSQPPEHAGGGRGNDKAERKAGNPHDTGPGKSGKAGKPDDGGERKPAPPRAAERPQPQPGAYFDDKHREGVRTYYGKTYGSGKACPPGLAKKNNGCQPPGQARKWQVGQPLPAGVTSYPVPRPVLVYLPPVPQGHKYVQVAGDILLIAIGTQMVVDGISGLLGN